MSVTQPSSFPPPGAEPIWGSYGSGSHVSAAAAGGEPLDPLSRRLLQAAGFLSFLLVAVLANSFLHSSEENPLNPIATAAERTRTEPGARYAMKMRSTSPALAEPMVGYGRGVYNGETGRDEVKLYLDTPGLGSVEFETVSDDTSYYMRSDHPELMKLPDGKEWMKVEPLLGASQDEAMPGGDIDSYLQMMSSVSDDVRKVGREKVRGEQTEHYRATIVLSDFAVLLREEGKDELADLYEKYAALQPDPSIAEAWIDDKGILRRMRMVMKMPIEDQPTLTTDMQMEFFDYGIEPEITLPDEDLVYDMTPFLEEELEEAEAG